MITLGISAQEYRFKAMYIYNFTKYIKWPSAPNETEFVIAVLGNNEIVTELSEMAKSKTIQNKKIVIQKVAPSDVTDKFQIIYISRDYNNQIQKVTSSVADKPVLVITEKNNACQEGSCINFIQKSDNLGFQLHKGNITKKGIVLNSTLLNLGEVVE
ncbi:MAG: YfiR family protein [Bacteroidales bacterium]|nr:YfiR family protein [Bacteroidales bacterium]